MHSESIQISFLNLSISGGFKLNLELAPALY